MNWSARMLRFCGISHSSTTSKAAFSFRRVTKKTPAMLRSEEHTSELQSPCNLVCRLLLEKKKWYLPGEYPRAGSVKQHVHLADGPGGADALLAIQREVARIAAALADVVARLNEHAARTAGGIVDAHPGPGIDDFHQGANYICRCVEFAGLLARGVGEEFDQIFVGRAQEIGEFEVLIPQRNLFKILDEVGQGIVVERALADLAVEIDALQHI